MTKEEKDLLLKDICSRVSNGGYVKVSVESTVGFGKDCVIVDIHNLSNFVETSDFHLENVKVYLRPMSSMTEKEFGFLQEHLPYDFTRVYSGKFNLIEDIHIGNIISIDDMAFLLDCLNK